MTEDNADRQRAAGWPGQSFPGPPASPYPSGPPARPSSASGPPPEARRSVSSSSPDRPPTSPSFTYSPPTANQISQAPGAFSAGPGPQPPAPPQGLPTAPLPGGPAPAPAPPPFGGPVSSPAGPRPSESPFSAPPRQSTVPGQAAASEVHQTIRLPQPEPAPRPDAPAPWAARPTDPFPQPGFADGGFEGDSYAPVLPPAKNGPGVGARVLGSVVGLLLGVLGLVGILVGQYSAEGNQTKGLWFGVGLVLLVGAVLLGAWTAATPITAGLVGAVPGLFGVIAPATWNDTVSTLPEIDLGFDLAGLGANDAIGALGTYPAAAAGVLLVVAGITTVLGRRRGAVRPS